MKLKGFENFELNFCEVVLNNSCPLDCQYCFLQNQGECNNMTEDTLKNVFIMCQNIQIKNPQPYISIMFALKEPMVSWKIIQNTLDNLNFNPMDYNIFMVMNTNGVLLTQEILQYGRSHGIDFHISLDGPKDIHDRERIYRGNKTNSSWDKVMDIILNNPDTNTLSCMTTLQKQDIHRIQEICEFMCNLPIACWVYALNKFEDWDEETINKLETGLKTFINNASPQQLKKMRIQNTAAAFPNINVINGLKIIQDGTVILQPPTPNDGAKEGYFTSRVILGNVNSQVEIPKDLQNINYSNYKIIGPNCNKNCLLYSFCNQGNKPIYISDFSCKRVQHFNRMAKYAKGEDIKMTHEEYLKIRNTTPIYNAVINVTDNCNLRCPYCFTEHNTRVIDLGTMKTAIIFICNELDRFKNNFFDTPCINFFGGEPMLHYEDIIKPTIQWTKETGIYNKYKFSFGMTSNGTLFNEDNLKWLYDNKVSILLSIDGAKETQDSQRPTANGQSSFDIIEPNLSLILKYFPNTTFRSAIQPFNADKMFENYLFARNKGFKNYFITPNVGADWKMSDISIVMQQLGLIADTIYKDISNGIEPLVWGEFFTNLRNCFNIDKTPHQISFNHCGIGTASIGIACNGDINGCQEHNTYLEHDIFYIGNIFTGIDETKHRRLLDAYTERPHPICKEIPELCNNCSFYQECATNYCPSHNIGNGNLATENHLITCIWKSYVKELAYIILERIHADDNKMVLQYLENAFINSDYKNYLQW